MQVITFLGSINSHYKRGKDRKKRIRRLGAAALSTVLTTNPISKEVYRYNKEGARSRLGKIKNDTKIGVVALSGKSILGGLNKGFNKGKSFKQKTLLAATGAISEGIKGATIGGLLGSSTGILRGFIQPNRYKKSKKLKVSIHYD